MTIRRKFRLTNKQIAVLSTVLFSYFVCLSCDKDNRHEQVPVKKLEKIFEIEGFESTSGPQLFWNISSICCDRTDNLIVADSGWNKIFKFNPYGEHIDTVGRPGQGPANSRLARSQPPSRSVMGIMKSSMSMIKAMNDFPYFQNHSYLKRASMRPGVER
ncbi:MAG: hypothetical protein SCM96_09250 [Acidobacteriota bacterium]|nr:hypothetical protein [Acidobacteriota bacterium]